MWGETGKTVWRRIIEILIRTSQFFMYTFYCKNNKQNEMDSPLICPVLFMRHFHLVCPQAFSCVFVEWKKWLSSSEKTLHGFLALKFCFFFWMLRDSEIQWCAPSVSWERICLTIYIKLWKILKNVLINVKSN